MTTFRIGCHLSVARGYLAMARTAESIGANTFQFFTRNPRGGAAKAIDPSDRAAFLRICRGARHFPDAGARALHAQLVRARRKNPRFRAARRSRTTCPAWRISRTRFIISTPAATSGRGRKRGSIGSSVRSTKRWRATIPRRRSCLRPWRARAARSAGGLRSLAEIIDARETPRTARRLPRHLPCVRRGV